MRIPVILFLVDALWCVVHADDVISNDPTEMHDVFQTSRLKLRPHHVLRRLNFPAAPAQQQELVPQSPQVFPHQGAYPPPTFDQRSSMSEYPPQVPALTSADPYESPNAAGLPVGLVEWAGANAEAFRNFFSGPPEQSQHPPGSLLSELAKANLNFVIKEVPRLISGRLSGPAPPPLPPDFYPTHQHVLPNNGGASSPTSAGDDTSYTYRVPVANKSSFRHLVRTGDHPSYGGSGPWTQPQQQAEAWRQYQLQQQWLEELRLRLEKEKREKEEQQQQQLDPAAPPAVIAPSQERLAATPETTVQHSL